MHDRNRSRWMLLLALGVVVGCHPAVRVGGVGVKSLPPALSLGTMSVEDYEGSSAGQAAFRTLANALPFVDANESIVLIDAGSTPACPYPAVAIGITPATGSEGLVHNNGHSDLDSPPHGPTNNGFVLARIRALDSQCGTAKIGMAPRAVYYSVARANPNYGVAGDTLKYEMRLVDSASVTDKTALASPTGRLSFRPCGHGKPQSYSNPHAAIKSDADRCKDDVSILSRPLDSGDAAVWIACSNDCCYADPPPLTKKSPEPAALKGRQ